jgi:ribulose-5-phosphate 4-epimerase/fuculose-1-phosphate aldolase
MSAVANAIALEHVARLAEMTLAIRPDVPRLGRAMVDRHFARKHGPTAYYGQAAADVRSGVPEDNGDD